MDWKPYTKDRMLADHPSGFSVIKPVEMEGGRSIFCPLCEAIMRTVYDDESYDKFGCCDSCAAKWVYPDVDRWMNGWRPSRGEVANKSRVDHI